MKVSSRHIARCILVTGLLLFLQGNASAADATEQKLNVARNLAQAEAWPEVLSVLKSILVKSTGTPSQLADAYELQRQACSQLSQPVEACEAARKAVEQQRQVTNRNELLSQRLNIHAWHTSQMQNYEESDRSYREAASLSPRDARTQNAVAWHLATCPDPSFNDGILAIYHASQAASLSEFRDANVLDTLAAAFARAGRYDEAIDIQEQAMALPSFLQNRPAENVKEFAQRLQCYRNRTAYTASRPTPIGTGQSDVADSSAQAATAAEAATNDSLASETESER